jgi:hypothetical protein
MNGLVSRNEHCGYQESTLVGHRKTHAPQSAVEIEPSRDTMSRLLERLSACLAAAAAAATASVRALARLLHCYSLKECRQLIHLLSIRRFKARNSLD